MSNIVRFEQYRAPACTPVKGSIMKSESDTLFICVQDYQYGGLCAVSLRDGNAWKHPSSDLQNLDGLELIPSGIITLNIGEV